MEEELAKRLQPVRVVLVAMVVGLSGFAAVSYVLRKDGSFETDAKTAKVMLAVLGMMALAELPAYVVIRVSVAGKVRRQWREQQPVNDPVSFFGQPIAKVAILAGAMAEGLGLFGILIYLLARNPWGLAAGGVALLLVLAQIPTRQSIDRFVSTITATT